MPDRRLLWPLLAYGALSVVAFARRAGHGEPLPAREPTERERPLPAPLGETGSGQEKESLPRPEDLQRLKEQGRGREASAPWSIPWRGWRDIFWRLYAKINDNRLLAVAGGVVFFGILALFPALTALVSIYGFFADASNIDQQVSALSGVLPAGAVDILHEEIKRLAAVHNSGLSIGFAFGLLFALWSANSGMKAIIDALNVAYEEKEKRSFIRLNLISLVMTLVAMVSLMLMIGAVVAAPIILGSMGLGGISAALIAYLRWPVLVVLVVAGLAALYRFAPSRREARWQWLSVGGVAAAILWLGSSALFSWYIANFGHYNVTYGSLGAAMGMMMWMWISAIAVLLGAQLNAEIEHQTARDSTVGPDKPLGRRGAMKADTIGPAQD